MEETDEVGFYIRKDYYDLYYDGNLDIYINFFSKAIKEDSNSYASYMYRGESRALKSDFVGALNDFRKAVVLQSTTHNWINKAAMEWKAGNRYQAKKDFSDAMAININKAYKIKDRNIGWMENYFCRTS